MFDLIIGQIVVNHLVALDVETLIQITII